MDDLLAAVGGGAANNNGPPDEDDEGGERRWASDDDGAESDVGTSDAKKKKKKKNKDVKKKKKKKKKKMNDDEEGTAAEDGDEAQQENDVENPPEIEMVRENGAGNDDEEEEEEEVPSEMDAFLAEVSSIKEMITSISGQSLTKIKKLHEKSKKATKSSTVVKIREQMRVEMAAVSKQASDAKKRIQYLGGDPTVNPEDQVNNDASHRMKRSILMALEKKLKTVMQEFSIMRDEFQEDYKEVVERRYYTITGEAPDEEVVDQLLETGDSETLFQQAIESQGRGHVMDTVVEIQERHDAVMEVERGLVELHQIFLDMATLVEQQGEVVDLIATQIESAEEYIAEAKEEMIQSKKLHISIRRKQCCIIIGVLIVVALIVVFIVIFAV